ncbi:MAG TPA: shikimate dehydrogenase [Steroidobacter sp.]|uniref:shikimate dehydrogenase n=1 Tax=Steroidobacter sp. TaxID=1978227 RepID=UPI002ED8886E
MQRKPKSFLLGLIGSGISASRSPLLHEYEAARQGLQLVYRLVDLKSLQIPISSLGELLRWAENFGFDGFNVTHPYKSAVVPLLTSMSEEAAAFGAANTIVLRDGSWAGYNTDWFGFAESLRRGLPGVRVRHVAQIGAGGAGAATAYAMLMLGSTRVGIFDIDCNRSKALAQMLQGKFPTREVFAAANVEQAIKGVDGVVLATPVGSMNHPGVPFDPALLDCRMWVADVIYTPAETQMLAAARALGCRTINGGGMLVFQAAEAFRLFTGHAADSSEMMCCFERQVSQLESRWQTSDDGYIR